MTLLDTRNRVDSCQWSLALSSCAKCQRPLMRVCLLKITGGFCDWIRTCLSTLPYSFSSIQSKLAYLIFPQFALIFLKTESHRFLPIEWLFLCVTSSHIYPTKARPNISLTPDFLMVSTSHPKLKLPSSSGFSLHHVYFLLQSRFLSCTYVFLHDFYLPF